MKYFFKAITLSSLIIIIASCNSFAQPPKTKPTEMMETALIEAGTSIAQTQTAIPTPAFTPTLTQKPTATPTFIKSYDATWDASFATSKARTAATRVSAKATLTSRQATCSEGYRLSPSPEDVVKTLDTLQSDTDKWVVIVCLPAEDYSKAGYTQIINHDGSVTWTISYDTFKLPRSSHFLGASGIDKRHNYLYLRPGLTNWSGWAPLMLFGMNNEIYRMDLGTGEVVAILPEIEHGYYFDSTISADYQFLVFSDSSQPNIIQVLNPTDKKTIKIIELDKKYVTTGGFTWTQDGEKLIFAAGNKGWEQGQAGISIFRLDMSTFQLQALLLNDRRNLVPWWNSDSYKLWLDNNILNMGSIKIDENDFSSNEWAINIENGQVIHLESPTSTPTP